jgi:hypothetical protein
MTNFIPFNREQAYLLPLDLKAENDLAHFVVAAVELEAESDHSGS